MYHSLSGTGEKYSTFQLAVAGLGVCLDPVALQFLKHIPLDMLTPAPVHPSIVEKSVTREPGEAGIIIRDINMAC